MCHTARASIRGSFSTGFRRLADGTEGLASQWANIGGSVTTTTTAYYGGGVAESVNGALSYTLSDGLGSVSESVSASTGTVSATQLYGPYGAARYTIGTQPTDYAFTHLRADATSGLDYYGARYYDPVAGQFSSADSAQAGGLNRYGYVGGNPESRTDPGGHRYVLPVGGGASDASSPCTPTPVPTPTPFHHTVEPATPYHPNLVVVGLTTFGLLLKTADFAVFMRKLSKAQQIAKLTELIEAFGDHNHWAKRPSAFMRTLAEKAGAEDSLEWWGKLGDRLMLVGAGADLVQSAYNFYYRDTRLDIAENVRWAAAIFYGIMHSAVMHGTTVWNGCLYQRHD